MYFYAIKFLFSLVVWYLTKYGYIPYKNFNSSDHIKIYIHVHKKLLLKRRNRIFDVSVFSNYSRNEDSFLVDDWLKINSKCRIMFVKN